MRGTIRANIKPVARQENIWLLFEQVRLGHLVVEAAGGVVEVLVSEKVDVDAALGFIYLGDLWGECQGECGGA